MNPRNLLPILLALSLGLNVYLLTSTQETASTAPNASPASIEPMIDAPPLASTPATLPDAIPQPIEPAPKEVSVERPEPSTNTAATPEPEITPPETQSPSIALDPQQPITWSQASAELTRFHLTFAEPVPAAQIAERLTVFDPLGNPLATELLAESDTSVIRGETQHPWDVEGLRLRLELADGAVTDEFTPTEEVRFLSAKSRAYGDRFQIELETSAAPRGTVADYLEVSPNTSFQSYVNYRGAVVLSGAFEPETVYTIRIQPGLQSQNGFRVKSPQSLAVKTGAYQPVFRFAASGPYFPNGRDALIPVTVSNVESGTITATRIFPNNILAFHRDGDYSAARNGAPLPPYTLTADQQPNTSGLVFAPLDQILDGADHGIYKLESSAPGVSRWSSEPRTLVLTDIGLESTITESSATVWARSLTQGRALAGVELEIRSYQDQTLAAGRTDDHGAATLSLPEDSEPYLLLAHHGDDLSFLDLSGPAKEALGSFGFAASRDPSLQYEAYLFTERGVYRPGELVELAGLIKNRAMEGAQELPSVVEIRDPQGALFERQSITTSRYGYLETTLTLPEYAKTGVYTATVQQPGDDATIWGTVRFRVNYFTPARMRVSLTPSVTEGVGGTPITLNAQADYYFGLPAADLPVRFELQPRPATFQAEGFEGYIFEDPERSLSGAPRPQLEAVTDAEGAASAAFTLPERVEAAGAVRYQIAASIIEPSGRAVSANGSVLLHPNPRYVGLRASGPYQIEDPEWRFDWVSVTPDGALAPNTRLLRYRLEREEWNYVMTEDANSNRVWEWTKTIHVDAEGEIPSSLNAGQGSLTLAPPQVESRYRLILESQEDGARAAVRFDAGRGASTPALAQLQSLRLTPDQSRYLPGATATLRFDAPAAGEALVSLSDQGTIQSSSHTVERGENAIQLRLPKTPFGSVYASVTLMKTDFQDRRIPRRLFGVAHLPISQIERAIAVTLNAPDTVRPGTPFDVTLRLTQSGASRSGQVKLIAVDEGVLALTNFQTPDPHHFFFGPRGPTFATHSLYDALFPEFESAAGTASSVAGDEANAWTVNPNQAKQKRTAVILHPVIDVPESGEVRVRVSAPEHNGALRLMAVAFNDTAVGSEERPLTIRDTLALELDGPQAVAPGDAFDLTASLWNQDLPTGAATVRVELEGPGRLVATEPLTRDLGAGERWTPRIRVETESDWTGVLRARVVATLDGQERETWTEVGVRPVSPRERRAQWIEIPAGESREIAIDDPWIAGSGRVRLDAGINPLLEVGPVREWLESYPYGCLEQTISGAMPALFLTSLIPNLDEAERPNAQLVDHAILRLHTLLKPGGRFTMWPGAEEVWLEGTLYAAHFLAEAQAQGFERARALLGTMTDTLMEIALDRGSENASIENRAYALFVLAKMGRPENELARALSGATGTHQFAGILLAGALAHGEDRRAAQRYLDNALQTPDLGLHRVGAWGGDPVRRAAFGLAVAATIDPASAATRAQLERLRGLRRPSGHWGHTQANAMAAFGYGTLAHFHAIDARTRGTITSSDGAQWSIDQNSSWNVQGAQWLGKTLTVTSEGPGPLYVSLASSGFPTAATEAPLARSEGLAIAKTYRDREGARRQEWKQGDLVTVELKVRADTAVQDVVIADLLPGFLEVEDTALATSVASAASLDDAPLNFYERRDDRLLLYLDLWQGQERTFRYTGRVVTPGTFRIPGVSAEAMYRPEVFASMDAAESHTTL